MPRRALISAMVLAATHCYGGTVIESGINVNVSYDAVSVGDGSENLLQLTVTLAGSNGDIPKGFEGSFTGKLHQQHVTIVDGHSATTDEPTFGHSSQTGIDTHFLVGTAEILFFPGDEPKEDFRTATSNEAADGTGTLPSATSFGTTLKGTFTKTTNITNPFHLARLVVPAGSTVNYSFKTIFDGGAPAAETFQGSFVATAVPEPSSFVMLTLMTAIFGVRSVRRKINGSGSA